MNRLRFFVLENSDLMRRSVLGNAPQRYKLHMSVEAQFNNAADPDQLKKWHISTAAVPGDEEMLDDYFTAHSAALDEKIAKYSALGSGWKVDRILTVAITVSEYSQLCRLTGHRFIPTPKLIASKKCVVNVQNEDNLCFIYAILSILKRDVITR